ncbi:MAG: phosphoribosyltransferase [Cyanobacteriota bacterium]|jgi:putative phosphoribosyl transferase
MEQHSDIWLDRREAGQALAARLLAWEGRHHDSTVVALPRGGVAVAVEVARRLRLPITTWSVRKLVLPDAPECAIGAIGPGGVELWDPEASRWLEGRPELRARILQQARLELERRRHCFGDAGGAELRDRHLLIVDDGIATGLTVGAAIESLRALAPASLHLAVPVMDQRMQAWLASRVESVEALAVVSRLGAVGLYYRKFAQLDDTAVLELLDRCRSAANTDGAQAGR